MLTLRAISGHAPTFPHRLLGGMTPFQRKVHQITQKRFFSSTFPSLHLLAVISQDERIKPHFVNTGGNSSLIYDFIKCVPYDWLKTKNEICDLVNANHFSNAIALTPVIKNRERLMVKMHVFGPNYTEMDFCGNGARAVGSYLALNYRNFPNLALVSRRGEHHIVPDDKGTCFINMGVPFLGNLVSHHHLGSRRPFIFTLMDAIDYHLVTNDFFDKELLADVSQAIHEEWQDRFPQGVSVDCVRADKQGKLEILTYRHAVRRIEQCATGTTASYAAAIFHRWIPKRSQYSVDENTELQLLKNDFWLGQNL